MSELTVQKRATLHRAPVESARAEALFVSTLQRSDGAGPEQVRAAVAAAVRAHGTRGCAALVAQEFGEHPEVAVVRMRWALAAVRAAYPAPAGTVHALHLTRHRLASAAA